MSEAVRDTYFRNHTDSEKLYWRDVRRHVPLTRDQEQALIGRIRAGEEAALERLVTANLRFVVKVAKEYSGKGMSLLELVSEGNLGLIEAARRFDDKRGCKFITYAVWWIRQHMLKALSRQRRVVRHPMNHTGDLKEIERSSEQLSQDLGRKPRLEEVAAEADMGLDRALRALELKRRDFYLDRPLFAGEEKTALPQLLATDDAIDEAFDKDQLQAEVERGLRLLHPRERRVIRWYFGLGHCEPMTLERIGEFFGLTRERVRQIRDRGLEKLREHCGPVLVDFSRN